MVYLCTEVIGGIAATGRKMTPEQNENNRRAKVEFFKTHEHPMQGKTHNKESRKKIGLAQKGKIETSETRLKKSEGHKGNKHSIETLEKMSIARKLYYENKRKLA